MTFINYHTANKVQAQLNAGITAGQTSFVIKNGVNVPTVGNWICTLVQYSGSTIVKSEKILVTGVSGTTITATRGYDGDSATTFNTDDYLYLTVNSEVIEDTKRASFFNYSIIPTVASGSLIVSLKNYNGDTPTAYAPVYKQIGDTTRSVTSELSITVSAGVNWGNAGSSELATKEIDYFLYLGYDETYGIIPGFSRIPYANTINDFSIFSTNEKYIYTGVILPGFISSGSKFVCIGRFSAKLSAGANYTWSLGTGQTINNSINESKWLDINGFSTGAVVSNFDYYKYKIIGDTVFLGVSADNKTITGSGPINLAFPFLREKDGLPGICSLYDGTQWLLPLCSTSQIFKTINAGSFNGTETSVNVRYRSTYKIN